MQKCNYFICTSIKVIYFIVLIWYSLQFIIFDSNKYLKDLLKDYLMQ